MHYLAENPALTYNLSPIYVSRNWRKVWLGMSSCPILAKRWISTGEREIFSAVRLGSP
jgi:hypothetical protein